MLNTGCILFENYSKRKPFVQSPKDYSKKPCKHLTQKRSYYKPKLKLNNIELYRSDRVLMDPTLQWDTFSPSKGIAADKVILKDLEYFPNKELTMRALSKGVPQFNKMTERNEMNKIYNQFIDINLPEAKPDCRLVPMQKTTGRDMKMYKATEALQNIANDNAKLEYIKNLCFKK